MPKKKSKQLTIDWDPGEFWQNPNLPTNPDDCEMPGSRNFQLEYRRAVFLHFAEQIQSELLPSLADVGLDDEAALSAWAQRWHLTDPWCLALARHTRWMMNPQSPTWEFVEHGKPRWGFYSEDVPHSEPDVRLDLFPWNPTAQSRSGFKKACLALAEKAIDVYCDNVEHRMKEQGYQPAPVSYTPHHFLWLARYQVNGETYEQIAGGPEKRMTVTGGVKTAASLIGLTLRPKGKTGPRRKD